MADPDYTPYVPMFQTAGQKWDVDPALLQAMARTEQGIDAKGVPQTSPAGAHGIMQFMPKTATRYGVNSNDATSSIMGAGHYMSDLLQYYGGDIPSALAAYNGSTWDRGQDYAKSVLDNYKAIQGEEAAAAKSDQPPPAAPQPGGSDVNAWELKQPPIRNLSPNATASNAPMHFDVSTRPGQRSEYPIADEGAKTAQAAPTTDYGTTLYGAPAPAATPPAKGGGAPAAAPPDYGTTLYGAAPAPAPAPTVTPGGATTPASLLQPDTRTVGDVVSPPPAAAPNLVPGGGADLPSKSPYEPPTFAPTPETWLGRYVGAPVAAMMHPDQAQPANNYLLGTPALQSFGSGVVQGARDIAQTMSNAADRVDADYPWLGAIDRAAAGAGIPTAFSQPGESARLASETAANQQRYSGSWGFGGGRFVGDIAGAEPFVGPIVGPLARGTAAALPDAGRYVAPIVAGGVGGGLQNALVSGGWGEDPTRAFETGALGGSILGGTIGNVGNFLTRGAVLPRVQIARDLDIPLSAGDIGGPRSFIKGYEDTTSPLPFSGEAQKVVGQQQAITRLLTREMGEPEQDVLRPPDMAQIRKNIGNRIDQATANIDVPSTPKLMSDLSNVENAARQSGPDSPQWHNFVAIRDQLLEQMANNNGSLPGPQFQRFLQRGGTLDNALNSANGDVRDAARGVRDALFDAASTPQPVSGTAGPHNTLAAVQALQQARYQWKVEEAVRDSIERQASGTEGMTFPKLAGNIARGNFYPGSPMARLSQLLYDIPSIASSGTGERLLRQRLFGLGGGVGEGGLLWAMTSPHQFDQYLATAAAPIVGNIVGARASRFGAGLGSNMLTAAQQTFNPLLPRVYGPAVGNMLLGPPQPQPTQ